MKKILFLIVLCLISINCSSEPEIPVYTLTVTAGDGGTVSQTGGSFEEGTSVTITATPNPDYEFTGWSGGASGTDNPLTLVMTSDKSITASFAKKKYALTVDVIGQGTVNEQVISAGKSTDYNSGSLVRLTAVAAAGWQFVSWSGISDSTDPIIEILVTGPKAATATFIRKQYDLTVNVVGQGDVTEQVINTGRTTQYEDQTKVELTAIAEDGWRFAGWSGAVSGDTNPIQITVSEATEVTATFEREYPLTVNIVGEGEVTEEIISSGRTTNYVEGKSVLLTAIPAAGWRFDGWTGAVTSEENQIQLSITQAKEVTATFIQIYDLTLEIVGNGEVTEEIINTSRTTTYDSDKTVRLTAVPDAGWRFVGWTGDLESTSNPVDILMSDAKSITATFVQTYDLTVNIVGEGTVSEVVVNTSRTTNYDTGTTVILTAQASEGWEFTGWTGDINSTDPQVQTVISEPKSIIATFKKSYELTINIIGEGEVIEEVISTTYKTSNYINGSIVKLTAIPSEGWHFASLLDGVFRNENPYQISINNNKTVTIIFERNDGFSFESNLFRVNEQIIEINSSYIDDDDLANSLGWSSSQTLFSDIQGNEHLILPSGKYQTLDGQVTLHLYKETGSNLWKVDKEYTEPSFGDARDYDRFGQNSFVYADHGQEFSDGRKWPYGYIWLASEIQKNNIKWTQISNNKSFYHSVASGDLNNDGLQDIAAVHLGTYSDWGQQIHIWLQNQDGTFSENRNILNHINSEYLQQELRPYSIEISDLNKDGYGEIILGSMNTNVGISIYRFNPSNSKFEEYFKTGKQGIFASSPKENISPTTIETKDINNDNILDLIVVTEGYNSIQIWNGVSNFSFVPGQIIYEGYNINSREFEIFDIDNDGDLDVTMNPINIWQSRNFQFIDEYGVNGTLDISQLIYFNNNGVFSKKTSKVEVPFNNVNGVPRLKGGFVNNVFKFFTFQNLTSKRETGKAEVKIVEVIPKFENW